MTKDTLPSPVTLSTPDIEKLRELASEMLAALTALYEACERRANEEGGDFGDDIGPAAELADAAIAKAALLDSLPSPVSVPEGDARAERERDAWIETASFHARNEEFYRGIVRQIGEMFGEAARTSDDGSIQQDVLALKVPELVAAALLSAESRERKGIEKAAKVVLSRRYGPPSMWGADNPQGWHLDRQCSPTDASMHDNGVIDAFKAIRSLSSPEER